MCALRRHPPEAPMSDRSAIEWTDATWNPVRGCTRVRPGCKHCYAETFAERFRGVAGHPFEQGFDLRLVPGKLADPLRWRSPRRIFVNSMSDLFQEGVPVEYIEEVGQVMQKADWHTYQVLTKRHQRGAEKHAGRDFRKESWRPEPGSVKLVGEPIPTGRGSHHVRSPPPQDPVLQRPPSSPDRLLGYPRLCTLCAATISASRGITARAATCSRTGSGRAGTAVAVAATR